jgi:hypothetical protein
MSNKYFKAILIIFTVVLTYTLFNSACSMAALTQKSKQIEGYPDKFDGKGIINTIVTKNNYISISDMSFAISPKAKFNTPTLLNASIGWFKKGQKVGYTLHASGKIESLWLLK